MSLVFEHRNLIMVWLAKRIKLCPKNGAVAKKRLATSGPSIRFSALRPLATKVPWRGVRLLLHLAGSVRVQLTASRGAISAWPHPLLGW